MKGNNMNSKTIGKYLLLLGALCSPHYSTAEVAKTGSIPNDNANYLGDRITFPVRINVKIENVDYCIPAGTPLKGLGAADSNGNVLFHVSSYRTYKACDGKTAIPDDIAFEIGSDVLKANVPDRIGITYGALVVPYKYHLNGSKEFSGGTTVGPYFGYRFDRNSIGLGIKIIGFVGGSSISVTQNVDGNDTTQNLAGFSYGLGIIGQAKNEFQMGVIFGADRVSQSAHYVDNGKLWLAVGLGYSFSE